MVKVVRFGEEVELVGYREVELFPTSRKGIRTIYKDGDGNCFWYQKDGTKIYVECVKSNLMPDVSKEYPPADEGRTPKKDIWMPVEYKLNVGDIDDIACRVGVPYEDVERILKIFISTLKKRGYIIVSFKKSGIN